MITAPETVVKPSPARSPSSAPPSPSTASKMSISAHSRNTLKASGLISRKRESAPNERNHGASEPDFSASSPRKQKIIVLDTRDSLEGEQNQVPTQGKRDQPSLRPEKLDSPAKVWSQSQTQTGLNSTNGSPDKSVRRLKLDIIQGPLDRMIGVEEGAGWFSPSNGVSHGGTFDERDIAQQPSVISLARTPSPALSTRDSKLTHVRNLRDQSPTALNGVNTATATETDVVGGISSQLVADSRACANEELEKGLDAASVILQVEKSSSWDSETSSRSSLSQEQLKDVAVRALKLTQIKAESRSKRLKESQAQMILKLKREQHRAKEAQKANGLSTRAPHTPQPVPWPSHDMEKTKNESKNATESMPDGVKKLDVSKLNTRAERYAALKHKAEQRSSSNLHVANPSSTGGDSLPPVHPVHGYSNKVLLSTGISHSLSSGSDSIHHADSNDPGSSVSTKSSEGGPRASRLAAARKTLAASHSSAHSLASPSSNIATSQGISQLEMHSSPRGSTTIIPTFDGPVEHTLRALRKGNLPPPKQESQGCKETVERKTTAAIPMARESFDPWIIENDSSTVDAGKVGEDAHVLAVLSQNNNESESELRNSELGTSSAAPHQWQMEPLFTVNASTGTGLIHSGLRQGSLKDEAVDVTDSDSHSPQMYGRIPTSLPHKSSNKNGTSNSVQGQQELYTIISQELERQSLASSQKKGQSPRRSERSSRPSDTSADSQSFKNPLRWWQNSNSKATPGNTYAIVNRAIEAAQLQPLSSKKSQETDEDIFEGLDDDDPIEGRPKSDKVDESVMKSIQPLNKKNQEHRTSAGLVPTTPKHRNVNKALLNESSSDDKSSASATGVPESSSSEGTDAATPEQSESLESSLEHTDSADQSQLTDLRSEPSLLVNLGYAIVDTIENACRVDLMQNESYIDDHFKEDADIHAGLKREGGASIFTSSSKPRAAQNAVLSSMSTVMSCGMDEQHQHRAADQRFSHRKANNNTATTNSDEDLHQIKREEAQKQLLLHAQKALELYKPSKGAAKSAEHKNYSRPGEVSDKHASSSLQDVMTFMNRLQKGIEVLKLGRQNKWQVRILVASKETKRVTRGDNEKGYFDCPRALIWLKSFDGKSGSITRIRKQGRGGLYFADLVKVEPGFGNIKAPPIPKRWSMKFPGPIGVLVSYKQENGLDRLIALALKTQTDADSLAAALPYIRDLVKKSESTTTGGDVK